MTLKFYFLITLTNRDNDFKFHKKKSKYLSFFIETIIIQTLLNMYNKNFL